MYLKMVFFMNTGPKGGLTPQFWGRDKKVKNRVWCPQSYSFEKEANFCMLDPALELE